MKLKKLKENPIFFMYGYVWKFSKGKRNILITYLILFFFANSLLFLEPLVFAKLLNIIQREGVTSENISFLLLLVSTFTFLIMGFWAFQWVGRVLERENAFFVRTNYREFLIDGILSISAENHTNLHSGDLIDKVQKASDGLFNFAQTTFFIFGAIMNFIVSFIAIIFLNQVAGIIMLIMLPIGLFIISEFDKRLRIRYRKLHKYENKISEKIIDSITNVSTVLILRIQKLIFSDIMKSVSEPKEYFKKTVKINEAKWFVVSIFSSLSVVLILGTYIYGNYILGTTILIGTVSALFMYSQRITQVFGNFAAQYEVLVRHKVAIENMNEVVSFFEPKKSSKRRRLPKEWETIEIKNLNFSYKGIDVSGKKVPSIKNINFEFIKGEKIAIIGESGCGKTTFLKVLSGLYKPKIQYVSIDGKTKNSLQKLQNSSMLVPQEPEIFATTIRENITMGIDYHMNHVRKFTDMATFTDIVYKLPKKWDSNIAEKGVNLSGGQKQRLALARALLAAENRSIVLLDESTSSVDPINETKIYKNVMNEFGEKTIIATIHKLNLLKFFDRILLFEKGKIVADGNFKELLETSSQFKHMWENYKKQED
ncbi:MAG: ABC transporter ATP-binding protein [Nanoarchaeota archaeon]